MKLRYLPWKRQKGCRALTTPAPRVQRLPAPPAKASTATSPPAKAASPARWSAASTAVGCMRVQHVAAGHVFDDRVGRQAILGQADPSGPQIGADLLVQFGIEAVGFEDRLQAALPSVSSLGRGNKAPSSISVEPASRGCVRQAAANRVISLRTAGLSCRVSCRSHSGAQIA